MYSGIYRAMLAAPWPLTDHMDAQGWRLWWQSRRPPTSQSNIAEGRGRDKIVIRNATIMVERASGVRCAPFPRRQAPHSNADQGGARAGRRRLCVVHGVRPDAG